MPAPELSLVLPMYNVRQYVEDCLASIYAQPKVQQVEVILVDDGSPDDSAAVAEAWLRANTDLKNWRIISQKNLGLGGARNTGLSACRAPYVWFIDTDDEIAPGALAAALTELTAQPDTLAFCAKDMSTGELQITRQKRTLSGKDYLREPYDKRPSFYVSACLQIWSTRFLKENSLRFQEHLLHEDSEFSPRAIYYAEKICEIPDVLYLIRPNPESITRKPNPQRALHTLKVCNMLFYFTNSSVAEHEVKTQLYKEIGALLLSTFIHSAFMDKDSLGEFIIALRKTDQRIFDTIACLGNRQRFVALLFKVLSVQPALFIYTKIIRPILDRKQ